MKNKGKQLRSRQTINTILDAAAQVLIEQGYDRATTNRIAEKSGYSVGTLYQYFNDKEDVYQELVRNELQNIIDALHDTPLQCTLRETLASMMARVHHILGDEPQLVQALGQLIAGPFRDIRATARSQTVEAVIGLLQAHRDEVVIENLRLAAETIVSATEGFAVNASADSLSSGELQEHEVRLQLAYLTMR